MSMRDKIRAKAKRTVGGGDGDVPYPYLRRHKSILSTALATPPPVVQDA